MPRHILITDSQKAFLARFIERGWLQETRNDVDEQAAVDIGLRKRWLRREMSEVQFTTKGRQALTTS